jgi:hypothetical protein
MMTSSWRIYNLLKLQVQTMVTGDFNGEPDEIADSMALPPHELAKNAAAEIELQSRNAPAPEHSGSAAPGGGRSSWLGRARAR